MTRQPVRRRYRTSVATIVAIAAWQAVLAACPICFQVSDDSTAHGIRVAVGVLLFTTGLVLGGLGWFAARLVRRSRHPEATGR